MLLNIMRNFSRGQFSCACQTQPPPTTKSTNITHKYILLLASSVSVQTGDLMYIGNRSRSIDQLPTVRCYVTGSAVE